MANLDGRITKLETIWQADAGCDTCRGWAQQPSIMRAVTEDDRIDGQSRPEVCPDCGKDWPAESYYDLVGFTWAELEAVV